MTRADRSLLLVHGFAQTPASWQEVRELLPGDIAVAAPELPGHGRTGLSLGEPSPELARAVVAGAATDLGAPVAVWGYSQGARVAFDLVLERPELVRALIIESGAPGIADPLARAERRSRDYALSKRLENGTIDEFVGYWEAIPALGEQSTEVREKQRPVRLAQDPAALAAALRGMGQASYEPMWDRLAEIVVPVLLITGADDETYDRHAVEMATRLPSAQHVRIEGAGHAAHISDPATTVTAATSFLDSI